MGSGPAVTEQGTTLVLRTGRDPAGEDPYAFLPVAREDEVTALAARIDTLSGPGIAALARSSDLAACLPFLLASLGWEGTERQLLEALPHHDFFDLTDLLNVMARLDFIATVRKGTLRSASGRELPLLFLPGKGRPAEIVLELSPGGAVVHDPLTGTRRRSAALRRHGTVIVFARKQEEPAGVRSGSWFIQMLRPLRGTLVTALLLTVIANALAITMPLYVMNVYDRVIVSGSYATLVFLTVGAILGAVLDYGARRIRTETLSYAATRLSTMVADAVLGRLIDLPPSLTERAGVSMQVARVRDVERVRDLFAGPLAQAILDLPFVLFFLLIVWLIGGGLAIVPTVALLIFIAGGLLLQRVVAGRVAEAGRSFGKRSELVMETVEKMRAIRIHGAIERWRDRFIDLSAQVSKANFASGEATGVMQIGSQSLIQITSLMTLVVGVNMVIGGSLTVGALVSIMMLVSKILGPMQGAFLAISRFGQLAGSIRQIDAMMSMTPEFDPEAWEGGGSGLTPRRLTGEIVFDRVTYRYAGEAEPALTGISFAVKPGEVVAIVGRNGSGKSTLLKLLTGLYTPQYGGIRIDGRDVRQFNKVDLRQSIAIVPQSPRFFPDTVRHNMLLAVPTASEADLWTALERVGIADAVRSLPLGLDTAVDPTRPQAIGASLMARLSIARALLKDAPIIIFDEPCNGLDFEADFQFVSLLHELQGKSTVFMSTYRPSHIRLCTKAIVLNHGEMRFFGPASRVADELPEEYM